MRLKSQKLLKEAKAFDNIVKKRVIKGFDPYIYSNKINNFFYNNPWRYPLSKKLSVKKKLDFVLSECKKNL